MTRAAASRLAAAVTALLFAATAMAAAAGASQAKLTVYAVPATVQFMNHADDRLRGMSTNPFNVTQAVVIGTKGVEKKNGPFPGDDILYRFRLYSTPKHAKYLGSATFTCYYDFVKHAICNSYFDLNRGLVLASGSVAFDSTRFTLSITGGTKGYLGALGALTSQPASKNIQRFNLQITGLR